MNTAKSQQMRIKAVRPDEDLMVKYAGIAVLVVWTQHVSMNTEGHRSG